jgi:disulfide bond formation protein DsbB
MRLSPAQFRPNPRRILLALSAFAALMLAAALVAQYGFGLYPCKLCIYQRYPYIAIAAIGLAAAIFFKSARAHVYAVLLGIVLLLADGGIAGYHAGVELGIFSGPSGCSSGGSGEQTIEEMRAAIMAAPLVTCDQAMAHIFGLSLAAWNAIAAFCASLAAIFFLRKTR